MLFCRIAQAGSIQEVTSLANASTIYLLLRRIQRYYNDDCGTTGFTSDNQRLNRRRNMCDTQPAALFVRWPKRMRKNLKVKSLAKNNPSPYFHGLPDLRGAALVHVYSENRFDDANMMPMLLECTVSKASARQRRGRAGRVRPGVCFHMCSSGTFEDTLSEFQVGVGAVTSGSMCVPYSGLCHRSGCLETEKRMVDVYRCRLC